MFNLNDYVRCVEPGFTLRVGAVYRVIAMDDTLCKVQGCTAGATWAVDRFIPWAPQVGDWVKNKECETNWRITNATRLTLTCQIDGAVDAEQIVDLGRFSKHCVPVLNRAPYSEGGKETHSKPICVYCRVNPPQGGGSPLCESCYRAKDAAKAAADFYGECECKAYGHDKTHMRHCVHHVGPDAANKPVAPEIKVPLGSTPTDEKMRREREERREREATYKEIRRLEVINMGQLEARIFQRDMPAVHLNRYRMLTEGSN